MPTFVSCINGLVISFQKILDALRRVTKNRTTIVIAHRLSTVVDADLILVLQNGQVAEQGSHFELIANPQSLYSDLWKKQNQMALESGQKEQLSDTGNGTQSDDTEM